MKIIFTSKCLCASLKTIDYYSLWIGKVFAPIIRSAVGGDTELDFEIKSGDEVFSRDYFFSLQGKKVADEDYHKYEIEDFNEEQISYLKKFFNKDTIVIAHEAYGSSNILEYLGCTVIDFAYHSYKLFDDLTFAVSTNNREIYNRLLKYQVSPERFYYYANYWKTFMIYQNIVNDKELKDNCAIFVGQMLKDTSVEKDGVFLSIADFEDRVKEISREYSALYYLPHPCLWNNCREHFKYVKKIPYIQMLKNNSTYGLLASDKVKKVVGISSSVLYEAQYFNKEVEYLYKPLFNIDDTFENKGYISIYEDCWNPAFWADILSPVCEINKDVKDVNYFKGTSNKLRDVIGLYWGYRTLDPIQRIPNFENAIKRLYIRYVAQK